MRSHLEKSHHSVYRTLSKTYDTDATPSSSDQSQLTISQTLQIRQPMLRSSPRWKGITDALSYYIAKDMQPLSTVDDKGFRHLLHTIEPKYEPPSRKAITTNYIPKLYHET